MLDDLKEYQDQIQILVQFVSGAIDGQQLQAALEEPKMQALLGHFENPRLPASTNHFRRLTKQDRVSLGGLLNSQGIIEGFLKMAEVEFTPATRYGDAYSLILKSMPAYLDPPLDFLEALLPKDPGLSKAEKARLLKRRLEESFKFVANPPDWIQSPDWPLRSGKPLVFIGQLPLDLAELFHDKGSAYVFYSPEAGDFEIVTQFY